MPYFRVGSCGSINLKKAMSQHTTRSRNDNEDAGLAVLEGPGDEEADVDQQEEGEEAEIDVVVLQVRKRELVRLESAEFAEYRRRWRFRLRRNQPTVYAETINHNLCQIYTEKDSLSEIHCYKSMILKSNSFFFVNYYQ